MCVAVVDVHGYAMHWDSFTSSSRGKVSGYKIQQVFSHAEQRVAREVRNILQLTLKKASRQAARKGSHGNTSQMLGEALLPSVRAGASRSVWELIHWHLQKVRPLPEHPVLPLATTQRATFVSCPVAESRRCDQEFLAGRLCLEIHSKKATSLP